MTSSQETEPVYSYNPGARTGPLYSDQDTHNTNDKQTNKQNKHTYIICLTGWLVFYGTLNTNRLYCATDVWNILY